MVIEGRTDWPEVIKNAVVEALTEVERRKDLLKREQANAYIEYFEAKKDTEASGQ